RRILLSRGEPVDSWEILRDPEDVTTLENVDHLMIEGGAQTAAAFLKADLVDRLLLYRAPIIIGNGVLGIGDIGLTNLSQAHGRWRLTDHRQLDNDRLEIYERVRDA